MTDILRLVDALRVAAVDFVVIGGVALVLRGSGRVTVDLDVCYARERGNLVRLAAALSPYHPRLRGAPADLPFSTDRARLIAEPMALVGPRAEPLLLPNLVMSRKSALPGAFVTIVPIGLLFLAAASSGILASVLGGSALAALLGGVGWLAVTMLRASRQKVRLTHVPMVARALAPLRPTESELEAGLALLERRQHRFARLLRRGELARAVEGCVREERR